MNELFKNGDYVLLEDCKAFDEKFGLEEGTTMWAVARKMEGGEPDKGYMRVTAIDNFVGIHDDDVGCWFIEKDKITTKLSIEDVLYRSKDGLTLDELSKIHGAYEEGRMYECVYSPEDYIFNVGEIYCANGYGISEGDKYKCTNGNVVKFKPATKPVPKHEWVPSVGDEVMTSCSKVIVKLIKDKQVCVEFESGSIGVVDLSSLKPIDQDRERIINSKLVHNVYLYAINKNKDISIKQSTGESLAMSVLGYLYDEGMLKEGDK